MSLLIGYGVGGKVQLQVVVNVLYVDVILQFYKHTHPLQSKITIVDFVLIGKNRSTGGSGLRKLLYAQQF